MARVLALVEPDLLRWARKSAGLTLDEAAGKVPVKPEQLESWERGESKPTFSRLRKLANAYKRPIAVFYLPEPPEDFKPLQHDFRVLPGQASTPPSPRLLYEIRRARARREVALDLFATFREPLPVFKLTANLTDDVEELGARVRARLAGSIPAHWNSDYEPLSFWRSRLEDAGILVFQAERVDTSEMRGFSISESRLPIVVLNIKDAPHGRIFTMLHELTHLMLREEGICDLRDLGAGLGGNPIEVFCNKLAGAVLVPAKELLSHGLVKARTKNHLWLNSELRLLSGRFGVSSHVILRRLLILGRTTQAFYRQKFTDFEKPLKAREEGFAPPHRMALSTAGPLFTRLVLNSYYQDSITASDVSDFLGIRLKHLPKIEAELFAVK